MKIDGWKRLWIVLSCAYTLAVIIYAIINFPPKPVSPKKYYLSPYLQEYTKYKLKQKTGKSSTDYYKVYKGLVRIKQQRFLIRITLFWLLTIALSIVLIWSIGWIYKGFKNNHNDFP